MELKRLFPVIVGQVLTGAVGLSSCAGTYPDGGPGGPRGPYCSDERMVDVAWVTDGNTAFDAAFDAALEEYADAHPDAGPDEVLRALYSGYGAAIRARDEGLHDVFMNTKTRDLLLEAVKEEGGRIAPETCAALCGPLARFPSDECYVRATGVDGERSLLECAGVVQVCHPAGRRFEGMGEEVRVGGDALGRAWAHIAFAERAAVYAFARLAEELAHHGAPGELIEGCVDALVDEVAHATQTSEMAHRHGASSIAPVTQAAPAPPRALFDIALENAQEGCVREAYAALETTWQSRLASDETSREVFARIASDETGHAELSWALHGWVMPRLTEAQRERVREAMRASVHTLEAELGQRTSEMMHPSLGLPDAPTSRALLAELARHTIAA